MHRECFVKAMVFLTEYYGKSPNKAVEETLYEAMRKYSDEEFTRIFKELPATFRPTIQTPFPLVVHFLDARLSVIEKAHKREKYVPLEFDRELADSDDINKILREVLQGKTF